MPRRRANHFDKKRRGQSGDPAFQQKRPRFDNGSKALGPVPKRKYAIIFGYLGSGYHGMQKQISAVNDDDRPTIEGALELALIKCKALTAAQLEHPWRLQWSRVGRTDKGVHAACQVVTLKMTLGPTTDEDRGLIEAAGDTDAPKENGAEVEVCKSGRDDETRQSSVDDSSSASEEEDDLSSSRRGTYVNSLLDDNERAGIGEKRRKIGDLQRKREERLLDLLRENVPKEFRLYDLCRVSGTFDARSRTQKRQYEYYLPSYILRKAQLVDNSENIDEFVKKFGPGGGSVVEVVEFELKKRVIDALSRSDAIDLLTKGDQSKDPSLPTILLKWRKELGCIRDFYSRLDGDGRKAVWEHFKEEFPDPGFVPSYPPLALLSYRVPGGKDAEFRISDEELNDFQAILNQYLGTHNWYNYTSRVAADDASAKRYMEVVQVFRGPIHEQEGETLRVKLVGQSFLLNQIRKMMTVAIESFVCTSPKQAATWLYTNPLMPKKHLHLAPGEGLLLDCAYFDLTMRNRTNESNHQRLTLNEESGTANSKQVKDFKESVLLPWMLGVFSRDNVWSRYRMDLMWHPFLLENFPEPSPSDDKAWRKPRLPPQEPANAAEESLPTKFQNVLIEAENRDKEDQSAVGNREAE